MKKNVASQSIGAQMVSATDGSAFTGSVTVYVTGDAGTQAVGSVGSGACTHEGNGYHTYAPAQAETNYDLIAFTFIGTGAIPATVQVFTTYPQTGDSYARLGAPAGASVSADVAAAKTDTAAIKVKTDYLPSATAGAAGGLFIAGTNAATSVSITGNITGNLSGSVGSVTGLTASNLDIAVSTIAGLVWDVATSGHSTSGTTGAAIIAAGSAGDPWSTSLPGAYGAGTAGYIMGNNLDAAISTRSTYSGGAVASVTGNVGGNVAGSVGSVTAGVTVTTNNDKTGYSLTQAFPTNFSSMAITSGGAVTAGTVSDKTGYSISGTKTTLDALNDITAASVWTSTLTESYGTDGSAFTGAQALYQLWAAVGEFSISGTTITAKKLDGATTAMTFTLDDATNPTSRTRAS